MIILLIQGKLNQNPNLYLFLYKGTPQDSTPGPSRTLTRDFAIKKISQHKKSMERQLWESVQIANAKFNILYVKETYNRCRIPAIHTEDWKIKNQSKEENGEKKQKKARFIPLKAPEAKRARRERINQNTTPEQTMKEPEVQELVCVTTEPEKNIEVPKSTLEVIQSSE